MEIYMIFHINISFFQENYITVTRCIVLNEHKKIHEQKVHGLF